MGVIADKGPFPYRKEDEVQPYNQPTSKPTQKVAAMGIAGSLTVIVVYLVQEIFNVIIPAEVAAAITTVIGFAAGYLIRDTAPASAVPILEEGE